MASAAQEPANRSNARKSIGPRTARGKAVVAGDFSNARILDHLPMHERRIEHSLSRTLEELRKQRLMQEGTRHRKERRRKAPWRRLKFEVGSVKWRLCTCNFKLHISNVVRAT